MSKQLLHIILFHIDMLIMRQKRGIIVYNVTQTNWFSFKCDE